MERAKRVIVFAPSLKTLGGGEYFVLKTVKSLKDLGFNVELVTIEKTSCALLEEYFGEALIVSPKQVILPPRLAHAKYLRDLLAYMKLEAKWRGSILFNAMANEIAFPSHISYIHALHFARPILENAPLKGRNLIGVKFRSKYLAISLGLNKRVFAVSKFIAGLLQKITGVKANVLYPPCKMLTYNPEAKRQNYVITISRFSREKNLDMVLYIAKHLNNFKFNIVGNVSDAQYYNELLRKVKDFSLSNVNLIPNPPRSLYESLVSTSSILLHTTFHEPFSISVVEAMSAGLVPVVHRSGGPWEDILDKTQGICGYSYAHIDEAIDIIEKLLHRNTALEISKRARDRAFTFSEERFRCRLNKAVSDLLASG
jgi:glycosyltransferase involved in cell wall biosynthesis